MIASLRRQHGGGRDFLQENKQRVSKMEANGRRLAAASARRVPLWRPVALHYTEKVRPHVNFGGQRRPSRQGQEAAELRSGLAQAYMGSVPGAGIKRNTVVPPCSHVLNRRRQAEQQEQIRLQGGWVDPRRKERPVKRCCRQECQCHQGPVVPVSVSPPNRQGEGDQVDRLSLCPSKVSRASQRERCLAGEENVEPEAPLSARSNASGATLKTKRSVSQESNRSNVTVKSNITVASTKTSASKKSQLSRKSRSMEEMPPPEYQNRDHHQYQQDQQPHRQPRQQHPMSKPVHQDYDGYTPLTPAQRQAMREDAQLRYGKLMEEYNHLPVSVPTLRVRSRRIAIEKQLDELDYAINMFDQPHMDVYCQR